MIAATMRLRQKMNGAGITQESMAATLKITKKTMGLHVAHPEVMQVGELAELVEALDMNPADLWTVVTGKTLKVKDLQNMEI